MADSPYSLSAALFRSRGYVVGKTEHWNAFARIRQDLFGIADMVAFCPRRRLTVMCQTTTRDHLAVHEEKVRASVPFWWWVRTDGIFTIHGWAKRGGTGRRKLWEVIEVEYFSVMASDGDLCVIRSVTGRKNEDDESDIVDIPEAFSAMPEVAPETGDEVSGNWAKG